MADNENLHSVDLITHSGAPEPQAQGGLKCNQAMFVTAPFSSNTIAMMINARVDGFDVEDKKNADDPSQLDITVACHEVIPPGERGTVYSSPKNVPCLFQRQGFTADQLPYCAYKCSKQPTDPTDGAGNTGTQSA